ncbi:hypothetical protein MLD63_14740 [Paracoccus sp. TK19116]|uniref:Transferrin-binding protein B C-lobe/N-lobe beta barrel domain-containing protein n=1 Tax=Paracoccus albicereus TaxID=2922394 RepID=A0ABT1MTN4_9RHOB|nr:hypothetical protein [Paracoccus albicereus]MCQ0971678.1 hypothetical protein [Paracoccus albicereus]
MKIRLMLSLSAIGFVTACGGGSSDGGGGTPSYLSLVNQQREFAVQYAADGTVADDFTPIAQLPRGGTARYEGAGSFRVGPSGTAPQAVGEAEVVADFSEDTVSATVDNFRRRDNSPTNGSIKVDANMEGSLMVGRARGTVNVNGRNHSISDQAVGGFLGSGGKDVVITSSGRTDRLDNYGLLITGSRDD